MRTHREKADFTRTKTRRPSIFFVGMLALVGLTAVGCQPSDREIRSAAIGEVDELAFGVVSTESSMGLQQDLQPLLDDMSEAIGIPVRAFFASDYAGVIEAMRFGKVHLGWYGNKSAIEAVDRAEGEVFAQTVPMDREPGYWSLIIVRDDSPYQTIEELIADASNLAFGNGDPHSTSGYVVPNHYLWDEYGIDPATDFKRMINANHESNALAVANGQVDFATNNTESMAIMRENHPAMAKRLRVIWKSPLIPSDPLVWRKDLPEEVKAKIRDFIFNYGRSGSDQQRALKVLAGISSGWAPFRESSNDQLLPLREIIVAGKLKDLRAADDSPTPEQAAEIERLEAELASIRVQRAERESALSAAH